MEIVRFQIFGAVGFSAWGLRLKEAVQFDVGDSVFCCSFSV